MVGKTLFAIKLPILLKNAMDYTAQETGLPLSKLYFEVLENSIYTLLGTILLHKLSRGSRTIGELDLAALAQGDERGKRHHLQIEVITDFIELIEKENNHMTFRNIFNNLELTDKGFLMYEIDARNIAKDIGKVYVERCGKFDKIDFPILRDIFFESMLRVYYDLTAVGSLKELNREWHNKRGEFEKLKKDLINQYLEKSKSEPLEAIEVAEVEVIEEIGGHEYKKKVRRVKKAFVSGN